MATTTAPDGTTIHYDVAGSGEPVVLVSGITESSGTWAPITERLATRFRVVTLDLRGQGESPRASTYDLGLLAGDVASVVMAAGVDQPRVVGHSLGGAVVTALAGAFPVASVVNVDQPLKLDDFAEQLHQAALTLREPDMFSAVIEGLFNELAGRPGWWIARRPLRVGDLEIVPLGVREPAIEAPREDLAAMAEGAAAISCPYLSLHGIDPGREYQNWLRSLIPDVEFEIWPGLGNYPHLVDPDRFVERIERFWGV